MESEEHLLSSRWEMLLDGPGGRVTDELSGCSTKGTETLEDGNDDMIQVVGGGWMEMVRVCGAWLKMVWLKMVWLELNEVWREENMNRRVLLSGRGTVRQLE